MRRLICFASAVVAVLCLSGEGSACPPALVGVGVAGRQHSVVRHVERHRSGPLLFPRVRAVVPVAVAPAVMVAPAPVVVGCPSGCGCQTPAAAKPPVVPVPPSTPVVPKK